MLKRPITALAVAASLAGSAALADHLIQEPATAEETEAVAAALAGIGCELREGEPVEKEIGNLFEIDDAACGDGQYDVKLNATYDVISLTYDGPVDEDGAEEIQATEDEIAAIAVAIEPFGCIVNEEAGVEKETDNLFELDDVDCGETGQWDIKLDGQYVIISITAD